MSYEWFSVFGIELEYMIVAQDSLDVRPIANTILDTLSGEAQTLAVALGPVLWSNELARHVLEVKTNGPTPDLAGASRDFAAAITALGRVLAGHGARLLPSGMHPWMQPDLEFQRWPVDEEGLYAAYDRIFDCRGHGWANLQSMHINLPFADDQQFEALHSAIRLLLPLLPALAASSPYWEGRRAPTLDQRLSVYRDNTHQVPEVAGLVIPEAASSPAEYQKRILEPIYAALAPYDPEGALRYEWANSRGAIARFDRLSIEIRVLDIQESPRMDLAIAHLVTQTLEHMCRSGRFAGPGLTWSPARLAIPLWQCVAEGSAAILDDAEYLALWGLPQQRASAQELWAHILDSTTPRASSPAEEQLVRDVSWLIERGTLAQRLVRALGPAPQGPALREVYTQLADCLDQGGRFEAG